MNKNTGDDGTDFDKFPLGHANLVRKPSMATQLKALRTILASFFRDGNDVVGLVDLDSHGSPGSVE